MASPQRDRVQALVQASLSSALPSSQVSPGPTMRSPQRAVRQSAQASASLSLPSSHCSGAWVTPSPQKAVATAAGGADPASSPGGLPVAIDGSPPLSSPVESLNVRSTEAQ